MSERVAGRFELLEAVGRGGSGTVYRGRDLATGQPVAIKLVDPDALGRARFDREAAALAALNVDGIVRYVDHGAHQGHLYLVEEWLDGASLRARLLDRGVTAAEAVRIVAAAAAALGHAHAAGIVHRDIKPEHLWLDGDRVTLIDFGIARAARDPRVTATGRSVGTPAYMAPEQARGDATIDARADVFALGAILYEALTGGPAFAGRTDGAIRAKVVLVDPAPLASRCPEAPSTLCALVTAMLDKDPAARPADAGAVAAALAAILADGIASGAVGGGPARCAAPVAAVTSAGEAAPTGPHEFLIAAGPVTGESAALAAAAGTPVELIEGGLCVARLELAAASAAAVAERWRHLLGGAVALVAVTDGLDAAVDRATVTLERAALLAEFADLGAAAPAIHFDAITAALLGRAQTVA